MLAGQGMCARVPERGPIVWFNNIIYVCFSLSLYIYIYIYIHIHTYIHTYIHMHTQSKQTLLASRTPTNKQTPPARRGEHPRGQTILGRGDDAVGNPHRAQFSQFEFVELFALIEFRQTILCRAVRANSISSDSILSSSDIRADGVRTRRAQNARLPRPAGQPASRPDGQPASRPASQQQGDKPWCLGL